jgi:hypothetical protein
VLDVSTATRYIAVATPGTITNAEWLKAAPTRPLPPPVHKDYALMKVLYTLRLRGAETPLPIHTLQHTNPVTPLDFSGLRDSDVIFIPGHGNDKGLYTMGPDSDVGMGRLIDILTADGNLKKRRQGKKITILLLSCRAGLGFHKALAHDLSRKLSIDVTVGGAKGFTFGSLRTGITARNEVVIRGIPWVVEYPGSIPDREAEVETSRREGKTITIAGKKAEIDAFKADKKQLEDQMKALVGQLAATEPNTALDEINARFRSRWLGLVRAQFELYTEAKKASNLEFDMWFDLITDGYQFTDGRKVTDAEAKAILTGQLVPADDSYTSTR